MNEALDGDYQTYKSRNGAYVREHFFGVKPELRAMVADMTDDEIWALNRGGLDQRKVYAAYHAAVQHHGQPTVILAKTIKGYGMGVAGEGQNITHQQKKMNEAALLAFRDRFELDITDDQARNVAFYKPPANSAEMEFIRERRGGRGGAAPRGAPAARRRGRPRRAGALPVPELSAFQSQLEGSGDRENSTTMAFVRVLSTVLRDKQLGKHVVPIVPDESRTFGMEGLFRQLGIFSQVGQLYTPEDREQLMFYREDKHGQVLQEGINEPGAMSSWIAAGTSYSNHAVPTIPFYIYYSMFGFQRVGDLAWAAGDSRARGFLLGGTAGRTTLNGEGLQHEDGHSHILSSTIPNCVSYDPTYGYEVAVIIHEGLRRMLDEQEDVFYYLTLMNENYQHPAMPEGVEEGILRGMYLLQPLPEGEAQVQLMGSGTILREVLAAADILADDWGVGADVWSVPSYTELRREGMETERWNMLHPGEEAKTTWIEQSLASRPSGPVIASTDYMRAFADQIRPWVSAPYRVLGTDGFGRSDYRKTLRSFFEVDRHHVVLAALTELAKTGAIDAAAPQQAIEKYGIDPERPAPWKV